MKIILIFFSAYRISGSVVRLWVCLCVSASAVTEYIECHLVFMCNMTCESHNFIAMYALACHMYIEYVRTADDWIASMHAAQYCMEALFIVSLRTCGRACVCVCSWVRSFVCLFLSVFLFFFFHFWAIEIIQIGNVAFGSSSTSVSVHVYCRLVYRRIFYYVHACASLHRSLDRVLWIVQFYSLKFSFHLFLVFFILKTVRGDS